MLTFTPHFLKLPFHTFAFVYLYVFYLSLSNTLWLIVWYSGRAGQELNRAFQNNTKLIFIDFTAYKNGTEGVLLMEKLVKLEHTWQFSKRQIGGSITWRGTTTTPWDSASRQHTADIASWYFTKRRSPLRFRLAAKSGYQFIIGTSNLFRFRTHPRQADSSTLTLTRWPGFYW